MIDRRPPTADAERTPLGVLLWFGWAFILLAITGVLLPKIIDFVDFSPGAPINVSGVKRADLYWTMRDAASGGELADDHYVHQLAAHFRIRTTGDSGGRAFWVPAPPQPGGTSCSCPSAW